MSAEARRKLEREIEKILRFLQTAFSDLRKFGPIAELDAKALRRDRAWPIAEAALGSIYHGHRLLEERLGTLLATSRNPLIALSRELRSFHDDVYVPNVKIAFDLYFFFEIILDLEDAVEEDEDRPSDLPIATAKVRDPEAFFEFRAEMIGIELGTGLGLGDFIRGVYESAEWRVEDGSIDVDPEFYRLGARALASPWFKPERWLQNAARNRPVFVDPSAAVPSWVAGRMAEVHSCIILELQLASIAMCRATLEAALIDRAAQFGVDPFEQATKKKEARKLSAIANELARQLPELATSLNVVITYGNQALHSGSNRMQTDLLKAKEPESIALHCFRHLRKIVERLYASS